MDSLGRDALESKSMENTGKVLFEDDSPQWYVAMGSRWIGPLAATDVYQRITTHEITWAHFVWRPGQADWERICDVPTFQGAVPTTPTKDVQQQVKEASKPSIRTAAPASRKAGSPPPKPANKARNEEEARIWFLYYNDSQFGPFSGEEISRFLRVGKIHGRVHIWKDGMGDWERLESIERFADDVEEAKRVRDAKRAATSGSPAKGARADRSEEGGREAGEQRKAPRRPLIAKILMADDKVLTAAVCRDISVGGMQVLTDRIPGEPGAKIKLNVSPAGGKGGTKVGQKSIAPFVAEGTIVRILEDGRGFSFRFHRLPDSSRQAIEDYIRD